MAAQGSRKKQARAPNIVHRTSRRMAGGAVFKEKSATGRPLQARAVESGATASTR